MASELVVGDPAPDFDLAADGDRRVRLADFKGRTLVLYFYPKDDTSGCTTEAKAFAAASSDFL
jgi:peroxiredoxin Q/BCP